MLRGRANECAALDRLFTEARAGRSQVLLLHGDPGIGKTALLDYLAERASGCQVVRAAGVESEMELAFAGLHQLCASLLGRLDQLPAPQATALTTAFGLRAGAPPDRFLVGLAVLSLLADAAEEKPLVCIVDDAHWLDQASARVLAFVGRRLLAERVALVWAARLDRADQVLAELPILAVRGLGFRDARALLLGSLPAPLDDSVVDQVLAESHGNPLALLQLPRTRNPADLAGGFALPETRHVADRIERSYLERLAALPEDSQLLVLAAAAEPLGDPDLLQRAATALGIEMTAAGPAVDAQLLTIGQRVKFAHSLVRSAVYGLAASADRRRVHWALAEATDVGTDPDRRAWHRARAADGPDEDVAADLERSAGRAQATGGLAAAAAFLERSAELTVDSRLCAARTLAAAEAKHQAGAPETALRLVASLQGAALDDLQRARVDLLRGRIAFGSSHGRDAPPLLLAAARQLEAHDRALARDTYLESLGSALFVGRLAGDVGLIEVAAAAREAPAGPGRPADLLLDGFAVVITEGYAAGARALKEAVAAFCGGDLPVLDAVRWLWHATHAAHDLWDDAGWELLCSRHIELARQIGALSLLPLALSARIGLHLFAGELESVSALVDEIALADDVIGNPLPPYGALALAAWQGREREASELIRIIRADLHPRGEGMGLTLVEHAAAVLYNGLGRYQEACEAAQRGAAHPQELAFANWCLVQLVEAAARSGQSDLARDALQRLAQTTAPSGTDWARGIEARSRALLSDGAEAESSYREAINCLARTRLRGELARAHLLYGEWLRRDGRRIDAREQLRSAHEMFAGMGMNAFAERAALELLATGERTRRHVVESRDDLTSQEAQIARLAGDGLSNPEIGARLFLSPRTVEWHLSHVFDKLDVRSRRQLHSALIRTGVPA